MATSLDIFKSYHKTTIVFKTHSNLFLNSLCIKLSRGPWWLTDILIHSYRTYRICIKAVRITIR